LTFSAELLRFSYEPDQLKDWRKARKLTQERLASELGISKRTLIRWEQGEEQQFPKLLDMALAHLGEK